MYNTKQRKDILQIFIDNEDKLFTPKEIMQITSLGKATVYRNIEILYNDGIINRYYDTKNSLYQYQYIKDSNCNAHLHLKCEKCGEIIHLNCADANYLIRHISNTHGFFVDQKQTILYGICKKCSGRLI